MADEMLDKAAQVLVDRGIGGPFACAMVLGTGLGRIADDLEDAVSVPYADIPGFPGSGVSGHAGRLVAGRFEGRRVLVYAGRAHYYEHGDPAAMRVPVGVLTAFGSPPLILTNAAGSVRPDIRPGGIVAIRDHINLSGANPLIGETGDARFVSMTDAYDARLLRRFKAAAGQCGVALSEGVYAWFSGPSFETPAEIRMAKTLGADLVGMSTVPEVILARRFRIRVGAISIVTNMGAGIDGAAPSHGETRDVAATASTGLRRLLKAVVGGLEDV